MSLFSRSNGKFYTSRTFWTFFFSYLVLLTVTVTIMAAASWYNTIQRANRETEQKNLEMVRNISAQINDQLQKLVTNTQQLRQVSWVHKFYSGIDVFASYFDVNRRREILQEMPFYIGNSNIVLDMALLVPQQDTCISQKGWMSLEDYWNILGVSAKDAQNVFSSVPGIQESYLLEESLPSNILFLIAPLENIPEPRAYVCYSVSRQLLRETCARMMSESMISLSILRSDGNAILTAGLSDDELPSETACLTYPATLLDWEYRFVFPAASSVVPAEDFSKLVVMYISSFIGGLAISCLLSIFTYRPLGRTLKRIVTHTGIRPSGRGLSSDYHIIEHSFETLEEENFRMKASAKQYEQTVRTDVIQQLLKGCFQLEAIQQDLLQYKIPFSPENFFQVIVISNADLRSTRMEPYTAVKWMDCLRERLKAVSGCRFELIESMDGDLIVILAFSAQEFTTQVDVSLVRELILLCEPFLSQRPLISVGGVHQGLVGISVSYHFAVEQRSHLPRSWDYVIGDDTNGEQYYYPLEWEIQLISSLKAGNHGAANRILEELRKENRKLKPLRSDGASAKAGVKLVSMILDTFLRVISELSLNDRLFMEDLDVVFTNESFDHKWECLLSICERICALASREKESSAVSCLGRELLDYVDDHFRSSDLCLKTLGDRFNLSIQSISKLFKTAADDTFYNYLYHKRMEYACHLLRTTSDTMQSIANQVGYENEFSFKRAFIRYTGIRPKDYMENNRS